jgi:hypothetical protein
MTNHCPTFCVLLYEVTYLKDKNKVKVTYTASYTRLDDIGNQSYTLRSTASAVGENERLADTIESARKKAENILSFKLSKIKKGKQKVAASFTATAIWKSLRTSATASATATSTTKATEYGVA